MMTAAVIILAVAVIVNGVTLIRVVSVQHRFVSRLDEHDRDVAALALELAAIRAWERQLAARRSPK